MVARVGPGTGAGRWSCAAVVVAALAAAASAVAAPAAHAESAPPSPGADTSAVQASGSEPYPADAGPGDVDPTDLSADVTASAAGSQPATASEAVAAAAGDSGRRIVLAAPWPLSKAQTDFYKMVILPDGYPAMSFKGKVLPHPMYGNYLIEGFLNAYLRTHDVRSKRALVVVARAAIHRMRAFHGGLVFWYEPGRTVVMAGPAGRAYSALTQAYYMDRLYRAGARLGLKDLRVAARLAYKSLLVSTAVGGVNRPGAVGPVLEEMPQTVPSATLNGWLSALASLQSYAAATHFADVRALLTSSAHEAARRLGRYDLPAVLGTSYSGYGRLVLRLDVAVGTAVTRGGLVVDGRSIPLLLGTGGTRSDVVRILGCGARRSGTIVATCSPLRLEVPVTSAGVSWSNALRLTLRAPGHRHLRVTLYRGVYRFVHLRGRTVVGWTGRRSVSSSTSAKTLTTVFTAGVIRAALTPTTFKRYGGRYVNTYHRIHIVRLRALAAVGGSAFSAYATRWRGYTCRWAGNPAFRLVPRGDLGCM